MNRRSMPLALLGLVAPSTARAEAMTVLETWPRARSAMDGNRQEFMVRFSGPVDHGRSQLWIEQDGRRLRSLAPRLGARPDTLHAAAGSLSPGTYTLHWRVTGLRATDMTEGSLPFQVAAP